MTESSLLNKDFLDKSIYMEFIDEFKSKCKLEIDKQLLETETE